MQISRRDLLKITAGATAACATGLHSLTASAAKGKIVEGKIPIGLQLYSVRHRCAEDLPGVLTEVAEMGYEGVEFAGYHGFSANDIRTLLADNGLKCCGTHLGLPALMGDALAETVEFNRAIGNQYLIVSSMPPAMLATPEKCRKMADTYNELAEKLAKEDMLVGYHAHGHDFQPVGDSTIWELFFDACDPAVVMQLDTGNCLGGGGDPVAILKKYPGRSTTVHLKEHGGPAEAVIGEGDVDWKEVFELCETVGGTDWYIVEHEREAGDPMDNVRRCLRNLRRMQA